MEICHAKQLSHTKVALSLQVAVATCLPLTFLHLRWFLVKQWAVTDWSVGSED